MAPLLMSDKPAANDQKPFDNDVPSGFDHTPVMSGEVVEKLDGIPAGVFLDATLGGGGHSKLILENDIGLNLLGIDRDQVAVDAATINLAQFSSRVAISKRRFDEIESLVGEDSLSGVLFDLGVSSPQLDDPERGFSYRSGGPLDMRMDRSSALTASQVVNEYEVSALTRIIAKGSDERFADRIATAIVSQRPINDTAHLAEVILEALPAAARKSKGHPAKRTFQSIRIEVNSELAVLEKAIRLALGALKPGGRAVVITYHSGEDRIVKNVFRELTTSTDPSNLPIQVDKPKYELLRPPAQKATAQETLINPRAKSARLRGIARASP